MRHRQSLKTAITDLHLKLDRECCWGHIWEAVDPPRVPPISATTERKRKRNLLAVSLNPETSSPAFPSPSGPFMPAEETQREKRSET